MTEEVHKLGEVLRAAREAKGVDLARAERDTKIRERYLSALERGEYRELPGSVYTKGFLRNYGAYLGLDPEYLIDLYRLESGTGAAERPSRPVPPRPIAVRRTRTFVVSPGAVAGSILTLVVLGLVVWIGYEFLNFARTPELRVVAPAGDVAAHLEETLTVRGITVANATVTVDGPRENPTVTADQRGNFEVTVELVPGSNVIEITAHDPVTERDSETVVRTVQVLSEVGATPSPATALVVTQPAADAVLTSPVPIAGTGAPGAVAQVTAALVAAAPPNFAITDSGGTAVTVAPTPPVPPQPATLAIDAAGAFVGTLALPPGTWDVGIASGPVAPVTRRVTVQPATGVNAILRAEGGESYVEIDQDEQPIQASGSIVHSGESLTLTATTELRILAGNAGAIRLTVNGISIGAMGGDRAVVEWLITPSGS